MFLLPWEPEYEMACQCFPWPHPPEQTLSQQKSHQETRRLLQEPGRPLQSGLASFLFWLEVVAVWVQSDAVGLRPDDAIGLRKLYRRRSGPENALDARGSGVANPQPAPAQDLQRPVGFPRLDSPLCTQNRSLCWDLGAILL